MKARHMPLYFAVGFAGLLFVGMVGVQIHYSTYARDSYKIAECETTHKFADLTVARVLKWGTAFFVNPRLASVATGFSVYSVDELEKAGLLNLLYRQVTTDKELFFGYGDKYRDRAAVLLQTIPSKKSGKEPLYCVVGKDKVTIDLLRTDAQFNIAVRQGHGYNYAFEPINTIVSWGRYW